MVLNNTESELLSPPFSKPQHLQFQDGTKVPQVDSVKNLGSMISWDKPFETAFYHKAGVAEETFKKLRMVWSSSQKAHNQDIPVHVCTLSYVRFGCSLLDHSAPKAH